MMGQFLVVVRVFGHLHKCWLHLHSIRCCFFRIRVIIYYYSCFNLLLLFFWKILPLLLLLFCLCCSFAITHHGALRLIVGHSLPFIHAHTHTRRDWERWWRQGAKEATNNTSSRTVLLLDDDDNDDSALVCLFLRYKSLSGLYFVGFCGTGIFIISFLSSFKRRKIRFSR